MCRSIARNVVNAVIVAAAALPGCKALEPLEPRSRDPFPLQVAKVVAYVPVAVVAVGVAAVAVVAIGSAEAAAREPDPAGPIGAPPGTLTQVW